MAASLTTTFKLDLKATLSEALDLGTRSFPTVLEKLHNLANGTGAGQADLVFSDERTIAASGNEDLDLSDVLVDAFGNTITMVRLKGIIVVADAGNTNNVLVGRPASNGVPLFFAANDILVVRPGGTFAWLDPVGSGIAVTAGTGDLINFANSAGGTGVTYKVILIGTSA